jgi:hypothetical protein
MSDSNRLRNYMLGFLAGLTLASVVGYSFWTAASKLENQIALQTQKEAAQYADPAYVGVECETAAAPPSSRDNCITAEQEAANEAERNSYDLEAQQTVAVWTRVMGKAAIVGMGVGILSLFLIFVTFWETRKAADAGREANAIAKDQQRARIVVSARLEARNLAESQIVLSCENLGLSPALNVRCGTMIDLDPPKYPPKIEEFGHSRTVKAGGVEDLAVMDGHVVHGTIVGFIKYDTLFAKDRRTFICLRFEQSQRDHKWYAIDCTPETWPLNT